MLCQHCLLPLIAERSTRKYHEACRSAAWRAWQRAERNGEAACQEPSCGREIPGYRTEAERVRMAAQSGSGVIYAGRRYCSPECRQKSALRRRAYRVAEAGQKAPYRVGQDDGRVVITLPETAPEEALRRALEVVQRRGGLAVVVVPGDLLRGTELGEFGGPAEEIAAPAEVQEAGSAGPQPAARDTEPDLSFESFWPDQAGPAPM
jgi:hypothetical protein